MTYNMYLFIGYIAWLVLFSLISFSLFLKDKKMAQKGGGPVRIKEKTLLASCVFGGAVGGFLGRIVAHHKTEKKYFSFTIYVSLLTEAGAFIALLLLAVLN